MLKKLAFDLSYSIDGINIIQFKAGGDIEVLDHHVKGLANYFVPEPPAIENEIVVSASALAEQTIEQTTEQTTEPTSEQTTEPTSEPLVDTNPERTKVVIIDAWEHLDWPSYRALASSLSDDAITKKEEATAAIQAELDRRAALK